MTSNNRGQISIEMIIVLAAVVAIVLILVNQMMSLADDSKNKIATKSKEVFKIID